MAVMRVAVNSFAKQPVFPATVTSLGSKGFSLLELVVVIAILGILISFAVPKFIGIQKDAKIAQAKHVLATII